MIQINLHCSHCLEYLDLKYYRDILAKRSSAICLMCGRMLVCGDINEPAYRKMILEKARAENTFKDDNRIYDEGK